MKLVTELLWFTNVYSIDEHQLRSLDESDPNNIYHRRNVQLLNNKYVNLLIVICVSSQGEGSSQFMLLSFSS